jgi:hypothetical protein
MSDLFQVTIVVSADKLGALLSALPPKLQPQISRLVERGEGKPRGKWARTRSPDGEYQPAKGTTGDDLLRYLKAAGPAAPAMMKQALTYKNKYTKNRVHKPQGVASALGRLVKFGLVKRNDDGTYGVVK